MKPILGALCIFTLIPVAASAGGNSPQALCLEKADRQTEQITKTLARLDALERQGVQVKAPSSATMTVLRPNSGGQEGDSGAHVYTQRIVVESEYWLLMRELKLIKNRRNLCARLSDAEEHVSPRRVFSRGGRP